MQRQIIRFSVHQTAKVLAVIYGTLGICMIPVFLLIAKASPGTQTFGTGFVFLFPFIYAIFGYVFVALGCVIYNFVAGFVGGIEVEVRGEATP